MNTPFIVRHTSRSTIESMFDDPNKIGMPNPHPDFHRVE
jgi:hypothetical protein